MSSKSNHVRKYLDTEVYTKPDMNTAGFTDLRCQFFLEHGERVDTPTFT